MNINKFLLAGIAGGIVFFFVGYLAYGLLLADFFATHMGPAKGVARDPNHLLFPYLILGNLLAGFFLAYIFNKTGVSTLSAGLVTGAIVGFFMSSSYDCVMYATSWTQSRTSAVADIATFTVMSAIAGAVVAWIAGMGKKA